MSLATIFSAAIMFSAEGVANSPFIVPVAGCLMILGIVAVNVWSGVRRREIQSTERLSAIAKGVTLPPTESELAILHGRPAGDVIQRRANVRRGGIVLVGGGIGVVAFFILLTIILNQREILSGAAAGLVPLGIGVALLIDARLQTRDLPENLAPQTRE